MRSMCSTSTSTLSTTLIREIADRTITTLHGRLDLPDLWPFYDTFAHYPLVSISAAQRAPMPPVNWRGTVYHGLPPTMLPVTLHPAWRLPRLPGPHLARKAARPRHRHCGARRSAAEDRCQGRSCRRRGTGITPSRRWSLPTPMSNTLARSAKRTKAEFLWQRAGVAVPHRLARALRPGPDRGDGLRHAGCGVSGRIGARSRRTRRNGLHCGDHCRRGRCWWKASTPCHARGIRAVFDARFTAERMARDYVSPCTPPLPGVGGVPPGRTSSNVVRDVRRSLRPAKARSRRHPRRSSTCSRPATIDPASAPVELGTPQHGPYRAVLHSCGRFAPGAPPPRCAGSETFAVRSQRRRARCAG